MNRRSCIFGFIVLSIVVLAVALTLHWLASRTPDPWGDKPRPRVVVTIPPLACFVRNVAGPNVPLLCLCTDQGPAVCEPSPDDEALLKHADLFLASGLGVDDRLADAQHDKAPSVRFRKLSEGLPAALGSNEGDPRVWMGLSRAVVLVQRVRDELKAVDPARSAEYDSNSARYVDRLRELEREGKAEVKKKKDHRIMSLQLPLRHFAESFGLELSASFEMGENEGAGSKPIEDIVKKCLSPGSPRVLAYPPAFKRTASFKNLTEALKSKKVVLALVEVDPLETAPAADLADPDWFVKKMSQNLARVYKYLP